MINTTIVANYLAEKLGLSHTNIEISLSDLVKLVQRRTIDTFSEWYPHPFIYFIDANDDSQLGRLPGEYFLNLDNIPGEILGVYEMITEGLGSFGTPEPTKLQYNNHSYPFNYGSDRIEAQMVANLASINKVPVTLKFNHPNHLRVYSRTELNLYNIGFKMGLRHNRNFITITPNMERTFLELAEYDAKDIIYNIRKNYKSISTSFGDFEMNIEEYEGMMSNKKDLFEKFDKNYWKTANRQAIYIK